MEPFDRAGTATLQSMMGGRDLARALGGWVARLARRYIGAA